jgi:hypothetical protein
MRATRIRNASGSDGGSALLIALMVMMLAASLGAVVVKVAIDSNAQSGVDRQRTVSINAAEAGIDASFATIEGAGTNLPCVWPASGNYDVGAVPDPTHVTVAIKYYDASGAQLSCTGGVLPATVTPSSALIDSTAQLPKLDNASRTATRYMQSYVKLTPVLGKGLTKAVFGQSTIVASNQATVYNGTDGDGNLYTNGNFSCANQQHYQGSVIAPNGYIELDNSCSVDGDVWAATNVGSGSWNGTVGGRAIASTGAIALSGSGDVAGTLQAGTTISYSGCSVPNKCFPNQSTAAPVAPSQPFPHLLGDAATLNSTWAGDGWTILVDSGSCSNVVSRISAAAASTGKTLFATTCPVNFSSVSITFKGDFAVFTGAGITTSQHVTFNANTARNIYMVVPWDNYDSSLHSCPAGNISFGNNFQTAAGVSLMSYTPCDLSYSNNNTSNNFGQLYAGGTVTISNNFGMTYQPLPLPTGALDPNYLPTLSYTVGILYKRETTS